MKHNKSFASLILFFTVIFSSLACTLFVGGPDYSDLAPIPVSTEAAQSLRDGIQKSFQDGLLTGIVAITITEPQITSYFALRMQTDPNLQQSNQEPLITDPQVYLRDGQMKIYGKTQQGMIAANFGIIFNLGADSDGKPTIEIASADFGPFPAPDGINEAIAAVIAEAYTGSFGPVATGLRVESITITDGFMTILGRIR